MRRFSTDPCQIDDIIVGQYLRPTPQTLGLVWNEMKMEVFDHIDAARLQHGKETLESEYNVVRLMRTVINDHPRRPG